jgi:diguanylate cyclase (GGDEF)-like protein/putative nucleotidyltransferase with HDIG domain
MNTRARAFRILLLLLGLLLFAQSLRLWDTERPGRLLMFLALTLMGGLARVGLPTPAGTLRLSFIVLLVAMTQLPVSQVILLGALSGLAESLSPRPTKWHWTDSAFHVAVMVFGVTAGSTVYHRIAQVDPTLGSSMGLPVAATSLFLVTAFPMACLSALSAKETLRTVWQERYLWALPYYLSGAALAALFPALHQLALWQSTGLILPVLFLVYRAYGLQIEYVQRQQEQAEELTLLQTRMLEALALSLEAKDHGTHDHLRRVTTYVVEIGRQFGLKGEDLKSLRAAALLHDIGKLAVPEHIISKPARLSPEEFDRLKVHPVVGADILERAQFPPDVAAIVRAHHEKWDGSGYPFGLKGKEIPLGARILSAVDCLDALASDRNYRRAMPLDQAMEHVRREAGTSFDEQVVEILSKSYKEIEAQIRREAPVKERSYDLAKSNGHGRPDAGYELHTQPKENGDGVPDFLAAIASARREEQLLVELNHLVSSSLNMTQTLGALGKRLAREIPHETMVLWVRRGDHVYAETIIGENYSLFSAMRIPMGAGVSGWVADTRKPVVNGNPRVEPASAQSAERLQNYCAALAVPLETATGILGVLSFYSANKDSFTAEHLRLLLALTPRLTTAVEHSLQFQQAENMAAVDFLTGLPNAGSLYVQLQNEVARAHRGGGTLAVLVCDLDGFKQVNDRFGHLTGNKVLQLVAQGLKEHCREYDYVARMGGDEYVVLMPGLSADGVRAKKTRFAQVVAEAGRELCGHDILTLSIGEAHFPGDGSAPDELLARADERMYRCKQESKLMAPVGRRGTMHDWLSEARKLS